MKSHKDIISKQGQHNGLLVFVISMFRMEEKGEASLLARLDKLVNSGFQ